jgi:hypothetical protein
MPTCVTSDLRVSPEKKTRSPRCSLLLIRSPTLDWLIARRGRSTANSRNTNWVNPEQSNASGPSAPQAYGRPIRLAARSTASAARAISEKAKSATTTTQNVLRSMRDSALLAGCGEQQRSEQFRIQYRELEISAFVEGGHSKARPRCHLAEAACHLLRPAPRLRSPEKCASARYPVANAAVRVRRRPQASEERRLGYPVIELPGADRRGTLASRIFRGRLSACSDGSRRAIR